MLKTILLLIREKNNNLSGKLLLQTIYHIYTQTNLGSLKSDSEDNLKHSLCLIFFGVYNSKM